MVGACLGDLAAHGERSEPSHLEGLADEGEREGRGDHNLTFGFTILELLGSAKPDGLRSRDVPDLHFDGGDAIGVSLRGQARLRSSLEQQFLGRSKGEVHSVAGHRLAGHA